MASFLRGKQAGMQNDLSANILPGSFAPDDRSRYGINSQISCMAFEPVQSLLAVGTNESKFGSGRIYVSPSTQATDPPSDMFLREPSILRRPARLQTGDVYAYDLDRQHLCAFRLPNFWTQRDPNARATALVSMQLHPRDIGKLLIAYTHGVVIYSFKQNQATQWFEYHVPPGAPGGSCHAVDSLRRPRVTQAIWHPTGTFILTAHDDGSLVFWDAKDGRIVMARTLYDTGIDQPVPHAGPSNPKHPYLKLVWCCKQNPEDTGLLIAGGQPLGAPINGLTFIELGVTPVYATSSWQILADYCKGKRQSALETPTGAEVTNFFLVPRASPHFACAQDPIAVLTLLSSGELITLSFPSGYHISPTNQLHPSLSFVHPFATKFAVTIMDRPKWLSMVESRNQGESILKGGAAAPRPRKRFEGRTVIQVAHADSTIRIWDVGHGDDIENPQQLQVDIARSLDRTDDITVTAMSMAPTTGEFVVGTSGGEVVIYRWDANKFYGQHPNPRLDPNPGGLTDISKRAEPSLKSGLQPFRLYEMMQGPISVVKASDVGFMAVGSEEGFLSIIDMRGPAVMYQASMVDFAKKEKRSSFLRGHSSATEKEWPVAIEFGVMTLDEDKHSSICCFVGTNRGKVITFKLLPSGGGYASQVAGVASLSDKIVAICPIITETGKPAYATGPAVAGLREGKNVNGLLVVVTQSEVRIFKPATAKGASKSFDDYLCDSACVTEFPLNGMALVGVFGDRVARAFSLPGLKELGSAPLPMMDGSRSDGTVITENGDLFCWTGPAEIAILDVWGTGQPLENTADTLINPSLTTPPRPTISNMQWISGTQYVTPRDLDLLIGGPDRPPSKRVLSASAAMERDIRTSRGAGGSGSSRGGDREEEGWGDYLTRQLNERTEKLNIMNDSMDSVAENSQKWADSAGKFVQQQKRKMLFGSITSKFS
ncbi:hypothetical protein DL771_003625 [Monosporascus sp. 5C6A]|nr:hypothetical protein DL771_003625 [Monosporascus sp. 5C6A]